ncbi:MAG: carbon storage regulator [Pirellulaceae bacterium]|jgi:sRNA-binding carbon storage regulator CsrA|nr:carbon storage regulator [Pirellulaceae bacterium]
MLVITRRIDERLILGDAVAVRVAALSGELAFLQINMPAFFYVRLNHEPVDVAAANNTVDLRLEESITIVSDNHAQMGRWSRGDEVTVTLARVRDGKTQLAIDAPTHLSVHRSEVWNEFGNR